MRGGFEMTSTFMQGGLPRHLGGYQNQIMEPSSPGQAWQYQSIIPKQEPLDEEKNDSGINSGSDFQTSSPGSDNSYHQSPIIPQMNQFYSTPGDGRIPYHMATQNMPPTHLLQQNIHNMTQNMQQNIFNNPLTPPSLDSTLMSPRGDGTVDGDHTLTPAASPNASRSDEGQLDALKRLQSTLEKNGLLSSGVEQPAMSPSEGDMDSKSETNGDDLDEQGLRVPKINSHGKVKTFKCKQCNFVAITKLDFWEHNKAHIKAEKLLTCPKCPFVTELKHHLEYHILNHIGSKPFKCTKCSYSCVNKSMLNSHLKSHSNVYQYRCENCSYATKYCHSLKLHLRKYKHTPAMVLNPDGSPNPLPIIDVYGTRRGPKLKQNSTSGSDDEAGPSQPQILPQMIPYQLQQLMMNPPQLPFGYPPFFPAGVLMQNLEKLARANAQPESPQSPREEQTEDSNGALDLSKEGTDTQVKNRRKGRAFKLNNLAASSSDEEDETTTMFSNVEVVDDTSNNNNNSKSPSSTTEDYSCPHCEINFNGDAVIYTMHMGYHGWKSPFTCNMCGEACKDKREFFSHIARSPHN